jgi:hypothetical protein
MTSDPKDQKSSAQAKKGGFGAFAEKYRDRWEADHPKKTEPEKRDAEGGAPDQPVVPVDRPETSATD